MLTRVSKKWMTPQSAPVVCSSAVSETDVIRIHESSGHSGIRRTLRLCRKQNPAVDRDKCAAWCASASDASPLIPRLSGGSMAR